MRRTHRLNARLNHWSVLYASFGLFVPQMSHNNPQKERSKAHDAQHAVVGLGLPDSVYDQACVKL